MILALVLNVRLVLETRSVLYLLILGCQDLFYGLALIGWAFERRHLKVKIAFIPYYFCMMNYAVIAGIVRYMKGGQKAAWEKSKRK